MLNVNVLVDVAGWIGVVTLLAAYGLVSTRRLQGDSVAYQSLNVAGSALLILNSFYYGALPSVSVNLAWIGIGLYALARKRLSRPKELV